MIELNRILCPVDFSPFSEHALRYAVRVAKWSGATLHVLHVFPTLPQSTANQLAASRALAAKTLDETIERQRLPGMQIEREIVESGEAPPRILERAAALKADLIIAGSHGRTGVQRVLLGSVVEGLLHQSPVPLLVVPSHADLVVLEADDFFKRIVCAVDFSAASLAALAVAFAVAEEADGALTLLHVVELPPDLTPLTRDDNYDREQVRAEAEASALTKMQALIPHHARDYCTIKTAVLEGAASKQILRVADVERANLIVLGVHGRNIFDLAFFGSNAKAAVRQAHCPVLVVPALAPARQSRHTAGSANAVAS